MNINLLFKATLLVATIMVTSCSKKDDTQPNPTPEKGPFVATVDGNAFPAAHLSNTKAKYVTSTKMLQIIGQPADQKETIILTLIATGSDFTYWEPGTYTYNPYNVAEHNYMASAEYNKWNGSGFDQWQTKWEFVENGQIVIESISETRVKGTFSFDAVKLNMDGSYESGNVKKVTAGAFDLEVAKY